MGRVKNPTQIHSLRGPKFNCLRDGELRERKCTSNKTATQSASNNFRFARKEASGKRQTRFRPYTKRKTSGQMRREVLVVATRKKEWFDDDAFWRELYPFMFPKERIADADEQIAKALALTKPAGKSVLDLCCGPGRCGIALAKRGFSVTGAA